MRVAFLLAILVAAVYTQTPPQKPVWPNAASASIFVEGWGERRDERHFFRWFYDETAGKERIEGPQRWEGELYWTETILDTKAQKEWFVVHQGSLVTCFVGTNNHSLPHPDFTTAVYRGKAEIGNRIVDHWIERRENRDVSSIYDRADTREIVRIDFEDRRRQTVTVHFYEFDAGTQDPSLFDLPAAIKNICNQIP